MNKAHELGASVWNHAWRQFGELAEGVLQNWKLETGQGLSQALHELVEMQAVTLGLGESLSEYQSLGPLKMLNHVAGDPK